MCEQPSSAVHRPDAWLCEIRNDHPSTDHQLLEPCLAHPTKPEAACPEGRHSFYVMHLAEKLPPHPAAPTEPWMLDLTSGDRCTARSALDGPPREGFTPTMICSPPDPKKPSHWQDFAWGPIDRSHDIWTIRLVPRDGGPLEHATIATAYR